VTTRFFADLNPAYPSKGQRRWCVFRREGADWSTLSIADGGRSFATRKSAERHACVLMVEHALAALGIVVQGEEARRG
jgi:hypothetical protein